MILSHPLSSAPTPALSGAEPVVVIGGGPAGLMAAEVLASAGQVVQLFDAMPSVGRKFLLAGKGGLNLTHSEPHEAFAGRYGSRRAQIEPALKAFGGPEVRAWAEGLGVGTFVGSSGRVFPTDMKAAPLLRAWLQRLRGLGVQFHMRHRWLGFDEQGGLLFHSPSGPLTLRARAVVLALGGASWSRLGSDGAWLPWLQARGVDVASLQPANCGFDVPARSQRAGESRREFIEELLGHAAPLATGWTPFFAERFAGLPFKSVAIRWQDPEGRELSRRGEFVATATGVEGSLIYAASAGLREGIRQHGRAVFHLDLLPDHSAQRVLAELRHPRGARSLSSHLKSRLGLEGIKMAVLNELLDREVMADPVALAESIKALPVTVIAPRPIDEAISTAGGVAYSGLDAHLMLTALPGIFCAGEMLDWEAPTGGYLLTACLATGRQAGLGVLDWLARGPA
ncbi:MAG: TIGR03862 family flavoprotein [Curvibacter sp.]|nr:TIGR03862 family flavoprotein [Curvibacter sp.]